MTSVIMMSEGLSVLVVDDEPLIRNHICDVLQEAGYAVAEAACADEALMLLSARAFYLVISDLEMPDGNGIALLDTVRRKFPDVKLVLMSGRTLPRANEIPQCAGFLSKPFSVERLLSIVRGS
jgi:DNA-binding NtrC family response regulator